MQKKYYEDENNSPETIVGNYDWHEAFPYETQLLYKNGDLRMPLFTDMSERVALDFGCGPGRMVHRMSKLLKRVDGVDLSHTLITEARKVYPSSNFYVSSGDDLGDVPRNTYDFVYTTIAMQHIAVHSIRMNILQQIQEVLKVGGKFTLQLGFNPDYPFIINKGSATLGNHKVRWYKKDSSHARWNEDKVNALGTNSGCDCAIGHNDIPLLVQDFQTLFDDVDFWFYDVRMIYKDLNGTVHGPGYWPSHWIFISGTNTRNQSQEVKKKQVERLAKLWTSDTNEIYVPDVPYFERIKNIARQSKFSKELRTVYKAVFK